MRLKQCRSEKRIAIKQSMNVGRVAQKLDRPNFVRIQYFLTFFHPEIQSAHAARRILDRPNFSVSSGRQVILDRSNHVSDSSKTHVSGLGVSILRAEHWRILVRSNFLGRSRWPAILDRSKTCIRRWRSSSLGAQSGVCVDRWSFRVIALLDGNDFYADCVRVFAHSSFRLHGFPLSALKVIRGSTRGDQ